MRIAIDLRACQQANGSLARDSLAAVREMAGAPGPHTVWIAFNKQFPETIEHLRAAFAGLLPPERILTYALPAPDGTARVERTIDLIRENFFANLDVDIVFTPGLSSTANTVCPPPSPHFLTAVGVSSDPGSTHTQPPGALVVEIDADAAAVARRAFGTFELALRQRPAHPMPPARPALAWIAAQAPGSTSLQVRLLAELARSYSLCLVVPALGPADESLPFPLRSLDWFEEHASTFDRIVYAIGNSQRHRFVPPLLARHPGIVVLEDFFLGELFDGAGQAPALRMALFESHGYTGLADEPALGLAGIAGKYPLNKPVLDLAVGVIVDSADLITQAEAWYGRGIAERWRCIPARQDKHAEQSCTARCASYVDAIEAFTRHSPAAHYRALLQALRSNDCPRDARHPELLAAAMSIADNQPAVPPRQLLVDVSAIVQLDAKTGISRVVRSILLALITAPPPGYRVEAVYGDGGNRRYRYARNFTLALIGAGQMELEDAPIEHRPGDIFLGLDVAASITTQNAALLTDMRNHGVQVFFVVYDILPLQLPDKFAYGTDAYFRKYLETIARHADGLLCNTRATADMLAEWVMAHPPARSAALHIGHFHLGADLDASAPSAGLPANAQAILQATTQRPTLLMVGTLEPRKAQAQALAALELLWSEGADVNLVIVGKPGWMVEPLIKKLKTHAQLDARLFWLDEASDEMLETLYRSCSALLAPSLGEGFGLPLIEAAQHGLPVIARRLRVFEEICREHASYFEGETPQELAEALRAWLALFAAGQAPVSAGLPWLTWSESARKLLGCVIDQQWDRSLPGTSSGL
ncbi:glycosyltransferase family 4 protein [Telluria sp. B2]